MAKEAKMSSDQAILIARFMFMANVIGAILWYQF
jgi:hypothetical protein